MGLNHSKTQVTLCHRIPLNTFSQELSSLRKLSYESSTRIVSGWETAPCTEAHAKHVFPGLLMEDILRPLPHFNGLGIIIGRLHVTEPVWVDLVYVLFIM